ncbi:MAG: DUF167 domain-containing protein [Candidatus Obscuribacterales bacterium]|nr:DUF167 domain-containing protein [Candidatus Obscuribacterales bacterium]
MLPFIQKDKEGIRLSLHVQPGSAKTAFCGLHGGALKLKVAAIASDGAANKAVCAFVAETLGLPKTSVSILHGQSSRQKVILIQGNFERIESLLKVILDRGS